MWRERPLLGFGPDNFRKLHADFGGWPSSSAPLRDSAHSAYLEAAASTGALGLSALVATFVASFVDARRALARAPGATAAAAALALLGLLAAIVTHATVDFLQSFTAQYIVLGFAVGAASALARDEQPQRTQGRSLSGQASGSVPGG
jgi:O-antigen ligase